MTPKPENSSRRPARVGLELGLRLAAYGVALACVAAAVWLARLDVSAQGAATPFPTFMPATVTPLAGAAQAFPTLAPLPAGQAEPATVTRLAMLDTDIPTRARATIEKYVVQKGDTVFGIAAKYNIKPDTILWGNPELVDNVTLLRPGKELNILPIDGALRVV
ncbi:MAG: LysM peptidoglycan-binding domain-containing protein, partial [Anaerolineales bacterium]|nr:LysM peptidoglycan-binding domain-containing protein [Anaerolineales bacterium]